MKTLNKHSAVNMLRKNKSHLFSVLFFIKRHFCSSGSSAKDGRVRTGAEHWHTQFLSARVGAAQRLETGRPETAQLESPVRIQTF